MSESLTQSQSGADAEFAPQVQTNLAPESAPDPAPDHAADADGQQKQSLRVAYRTVRKNIATDVRKKANRAVLQKLSACQAVASAKTILIYAANPFEINLDELIGALSRAGKRVAVPRLTKAPGVMTLWVVRHVDALLETDAKVRTVDVSRAVPIEPKDIDLVLVPGVAFSKTMDRLGQGGGYYDRILKRLPLHAKRVGIAFEVQMADTLPIEAHDVSMDAVATESNIYGDAALLAPALVQPKDGAPPTCGAKYSRNF